MAPAFLHVNDLGKSYGQVRAVDGISLEIPRGSIYGFLGPNGSGKTTTIRCIMNIILADRGEILFDGRPLDRLLLDRVGYMPEERGLYRKMKCAEQLAFLATLKSVPRKEALRRAEAWLERLGLGEWKDRKVDALSKGMQQKVQFAATFLFEPDLVILDEPFSGLDPLNVETMRDVIREQNARGCTIILSTHMLAEAEKLCDSVCLIEGGRKVLDGTLEAVRTDFPLKSVRVAYAGGKEPPARLPGIAHRVFQDDSWRLTLEAGASTDAVLDALRAGGQLTLFAANRPALDEIFLSVVRERRAAAGTEAAS